MWLKGDMSRRRKAMPITATVMVVGLIVAAIIGVGPQWGTTPRPVVATTTLRGGDQAGPPPLVAVAMTPPMGWNGFNRFYIHVDAARVEAAARALVSSGMRAAGYLYVNLDGGWDLYDRNPEGALQPNPITFPTGIRPVADYVHALGLKFGIYASAGVRNCGGRSAGSYGHYWQDAAAFASWGVDYLKLDWCRIPYDDFPHMTHAQVGQVLASEMAQALAATGRSIVYDVNDETDDMPWAWAPRLAHLWRTTPDIHDKYASMVWNFTHNVNHFVVARPGGWNDPDMLEIGNGGMSDVEYRSQFSLWSEMAAPLIAGNDLTVMSQTTAAILTNSALIAVDQDPMGMQGYPVASAGGHWVLTKPLANGDRSVVLFNETDKPATITTSVSQVGLQKGLDYMLVDLWNGTASGTTDVISAVVPAHGVVVYRISEIEPPVTVSP
jgi:alpha-galactosidase